MMSRDVSGAYYYYNLISMRPQWQPPPPPLTMPGGWSMFWCPKSGKPYFFDEAKGVSFWEPSWKVQMDEVVSALPDGLDDQVAEGGENFSQKRRPKVSKVVLIGDSALQLNRSKGTTGFDTEFNDFLNKNDVLGPGACGYVRRHAGATGVKLLGHLRKTCEHDIDCVGLVWMLRVARRRTPVQLRLTLAASALSFSTLPYVASHTNCPFTRLLGRTSNYGASFS